MKTLALALVTLLGVLLASVGLAAVKNVVLVHRAFADGSGWKPVADVLRHDGFTVYVIQEPETTFEADVAATRLVLDRSGPCVLVGHSYGGMIITEAGVHPSVKALVYVAAFQPNVGESAAELNSKIPAASNSIAPVRISSTIQKECARTIGSSIIAPLVTSTRCFRSRSCEETCPTITLASACS